MKDRVVQPAKITTFSVYKGNHFYVLLLSSRCMLNMKRLVILKHKWRKTSKANSENNLEVRRQLY